MYRQSSSRLTSFLFILFIISINVLLSRSQSTSPLGEIDISSSLLIKSVAVETNYQFRVDSTITTPKISISLSRGSASDIKEFVNTANASQIVIGEPTPAESQDVISGSNRVALALVSMISCLFGGIFLMNGGSTANSGAKLIAMVAVIAITLSTAYAAITMGDLTVEATIVIPIGFNFDSIEIQAGKGSLAMNGLQATNLNIGACNGFDFPVFLNGLYSQNIKICTNSEITASNVQLTNTPSIISLTSNQDHINLDFVSAYNGQAKFDTHQSATSDIIGSQSCTLTSSTTDTRSVKEGTCGTSPTGNQLTLVAQTGVSVLVYNSESCPTLATWRDPPPLATGPDSPPIITTLPAASYVFPTTLDQWVVMSDWEEFYEVTIPPASTTVNGVDVSGSLKVQFGGPDIFWIVSSTESNFLRGGQNYQFSFQFLMGQAQTAETYVQGAKLCALQGLHQDFIIDTSHWLPENPSNYSTYTCYPFTTTNFASSTSWTTNTASFTPLQDIPSSRLAIQFNYTTPWGNFPVFYYKALTLSVPQRPVPSVTPITVDSELVKLRKPSTSTTPQSYSTCPHQQSGLKHWHDPATWGGVLPNPSGVITLPANTKVLISSCSLQSGVIYQKIVIPATSELIFSDANITMHLQDMYVQGKLWIGSATCRLNGNIELIFHGAFTTADTIAQYMGSKGIAGTPASFMSIQGKQYKNTWTRLSASVYPFDRLIYLQDVVNWEVGQQIVLTTSRYEDEYYPENEVLTIQAISANGKTVQVVESIQFHHYAGPEYQAEVGLLSRRIILRGDLTSSQPNNFGGHVLTMGNSQFSGIELVNMGQRNQRARYPLHFHLSGIVNNSYVSDCSVHSTYYRCITIHGTHNLTVTENVAYDATGHCYYIEDGIEENNTVSYNLAAKVHTIFATAAGTRQQGQWFNESDALRQPADTAAAGFYITNAYNRVYGNAASGGWASYSFPNLPNSIGFYKNVTFNPSSRPVLEFDGNTAHSAGYQFGFGSCVYCGGVLYIMSNGNLTYQSGRPADARETKFPNGTYAWMTFTNTKTFLCSDGVGHWGQRIEVVKYESHDNHRSGTLFGDSWLSNAIVNGQSGNSNRPKASKQGFQFYDTWTKTVLSNVNFRNYIALPKQPSNPQDDNRVLVSMTHSDVFKPQGISATRNITFTNVAIKQRIGHNVTNTGASRYFNFVDWDGSFSGRNVPTIFGSHLNWWQYDNTCILSPDWGIYHCEKGGAGREIGNLDLYVPGVINDVEEDPNTVVGASTLFGPGITGVARTSPITNNIGITGVTGIGWYLYLDSGAPTQFKISTRLVPYGTYIMVAMRYPPNTQFSIDQWYQWRSPQAGPKFNATASFTDLLNGNGAAYYFDNTHLYLKIVNPRLSNAPDEKFTRDGTSIFTIYTGFWYRVNATCVSCNMAVTDVRPTIWS